MVENYLCNTLLIKLAFLFIIFLVLVESSDWRYETCKPRNCGTGPEIRYPFYIEDQNATYDSPCGYPGFEVCCVDNKPMFTTSSGQFILTSVSYENRTFHLVDVDAFNSTTCMTPSFFSFDRSSFNFGPDVISLCLLYGCDNNTFKYVENPIDCASNSSYHTYAVLDNGHEILCEELPCESYVASPIDLAGVSNVSAESKVGNYTKLLENGFTLTWEGHDCHECEKSGGYCGFDGNTTMCYCPEKPHSFTCKNGKSKLGVILGTVGGGFFMLMSILVPYIVWRRKKGIDEVPYIHSSRMSEPSLEESSDIVAEGENVFFGIPVFSYTELEVITNKFNESNELGYGGFGTVYYGKLKDGREVAIKYLYGHNYKTMQQFKNELEILTRLRHRNLVSLYGCTSKRSRELLLVYEYIPNGTVADHLHGNRGKDRSLSWHVRMNIAIETAVALAYLHASDIIHRDVKTNNILLDHNFCVKVADFGLSRLFPNDVTHVSTAPQGTPGYVDPEYYQCYQLTDKSDVYSFGVVLIELMSSLPAVDMNRPSNDINLSSFAMSRIHRRAFTELIDPSLRIESDPDVKRMSKSVSELAFRCLQHDKDMRPTMEEVAEGLKVIQSNKENVEEVAEGLKVIQSNKENVFVGPSPDSDHVLLKKDVKLPFSPTSVAHTWTSGSSVSTTSR